MIRGGLLGTIRYELGELSSHQCSAAKKDKSNNPSIPWLLLIDHANDLRGEKGTVEEQDLKRILTREF